MARLRRADCSGPGIRRRRRGKGFEYLDEDGARVTEPSVLERVRELAIPPAWEDVWICPYPMGHLQATGVDSVGRKQYRYHDRWRERRDQEKFDSMVRFAEALPKLRERVANDLALEGMPKDRAVACAVRLMDLGFFRIGSEDYAEENDTYGIATMERRHVTVSGTEITFDYEAKGGQQRIQAISDPAAAEVVRSLKRRRGGSDDLLAYKSGARWADVRSPDINEYVKEAAGEEFSAKDFRTWSGTVLAAVALAASATAAAEGTKTSRKRAKSRAITEVAHHLGNTPAVARSSYIDPRIFDRFDGGLTISGVLPDLAEGSEEDRAESQRQIEEGVLDLIARDIASSAVERAAQVASELEEVAA